MELSNDFFRRQQMDASFTRGMDEPLEDVYDLTSALFDSRNPTADEKAILYFS